MFYLLVFLSFFSFFALCFFTHCSFPMPPFAYLTSLSAFLPPLPFLLSALQIPTDEMAKSEEDGKQSINEMLNNGGRVWHGGWNGLGWQAKGSSTTN